MRKDVYVCNEADHFVLGSSAAKGGDDTACVEAGLALEVHLAQDDAFVARVVVGELSAEERQEWVARMEGTLDLRDGRLLVSVGPTIFEAFDDGDEDDEENLADYLRRVDVPPGRYAVTVYAFYPTQEADGAVDLEAAGYDGHARWFAATRPGETAPSWLESFNKGPDDFLTYEEEAEDDDGHGVDCRWVNYLVHLRPLPDGARVGNDPDAGYAWQGRMPERCPRGVRAAEVHVHPSCCAPHDRSELEAGWAARARALLERAGPAAPLEGDPIAVPFSELPRVLLFLSLIRDGGTVVPGFEASPEEPFHSPLEVYGAVVGDGRGWSVLALPEQAMKLHLQRWVSDLDQALALLTGRKGFRLDLFDDESDAWLLRLAGPVRDGKWLIEATGPAVPAAAIRRGLEIAATVADEKVPFRMGSAQEADGLAALLDDFGGILMEPVARKGLSFRPDEVDRLDVGALVLRLYHERDLPLPSAEELHRDASGWKDFVDVMGALACGKDDEGGEGDWDARGELVFEGRSGGFHVVDVEALSGHRALLAERDDTMRRIGFLPFADLIADAAPVVAMRGYGQNGGFAYGLLLQPMMGTPICDFYTEFADGSSLTTSQASGLDLPERGIYRQEAPGLPLDELCALHFEGIARRTGEAGAPQPHPPLAEALAESIDAFIIRQAGG